MARRKDHTAEQLKELIQSCGEKLIFRNGIAGLTARALAHEIGYTPGTIYNFYRDLNALIIDINYRTLGHLQQHCEQQISGLADDFQKIKTLAYAYLEFAEQNPQAWQTLFGYTRNGKGNHSELPDYYLNRLTTLFQLIESTLTACMNVNVNQVHSTARLLWASIHGIAVLTFDGQLKLLGVADPRTIIDQLLEGQRLLFT